MGIKINDLRVTDVEYPRILLKKNLMLPQM